MEARRLPWPSALSNDSDRAAPQEVASDREHELTCLRTMEERESVKRIQLSIRRRWQMSSDISDPDALSYRVGQKRNPSRLISHLRVRREHPLRSVGADVGALRSEFFILHGHSRFIRPPKGRIELAPGPLRRGPRKQMQVPDDLAEEGLRTK